LKAFVVVTDNDWFAFLTGLPQTDDVNLWQPGEYILLVLNNPFNHASLKD
jgi:hypothetical protein